MDYLQTKSQTNGKWIEDPCWTLDENDILYYKGQIHVSNIGDLQLQVLNSKYNHVLASYLEQSKTYQMVCWDFNWLGLQEFVIDYVKSCNVYRRNKVHCHKPYRLLKQLLILPQLWESILIDFIKQLLLSGGHTDILVIVDQLTKQALFILIIKSLNTTTLAELFVRHIFFKYRVPSYVTSD